MGTSHDTYPVERRGRRWRDIAVGLAGGLCLALLLQGPVPDPALAQNARLIPDRDMTVDALILALGSLAVDTEMSAVGVAQVRDEMRRLERRIAALERSKPP
jgi:hypothetical protein